MEQKEPNFYATIKDAALLAVKEIAELRAERDAALLQVSELKAHSERVGATNQIRWDDYVKATNRADAAERLIDAALVALTMGASHPKDPNRIDKAIEILLRAPEKRICEDGRHDYKPDPGNVIVKCTKCGDIEASG